MTTRIEEYVRINLCRFLSEANELVSEGEVNKAMVLDDKARQIDETLEITASSWGKLCWNGSVRGSASAVLDACDRAVRLDPDDGCYHRSRGLARALNGNLGGAIEDFQYCMRWAKSEGKQSEESIVKHGRWIKVLGSPLKAGQNMALDG